VSRPGATRLAVLIACVAFLGAGALTARGESVHVARALPATDEVVLSAVLVCDAELSAHAPREPAEQQWCESVFYTGVVAAYELTGDRPYLASTCDWCRTRTWSLERREGHPDDLVAAQVYIDLARVDGGTAGLDAAEEAFDAVLLDSLAGRDAWPWCDALFMAPPAMAALSAATDDERYVDAMDDMWWDAAATLYDTSYCLFHGDIRQRDWARARAEEGRAAAGGAPGGRGGRAGRGSGDEHPRFWGRGNGWVAAGTARVLDALPIDHPSRGRYERLLSEMCGAVAKLQGDDGLWRPQLLRSRERLGPDSSCSSLFCFAMAWGVNEGLLPRAEFEPVIASAWAGLESCMDETGRLGWVQQIASSPGAVMADHHGDFGAGAFLLAAREVARLSTR